MENLYEGASCKTLVLVVLDFLEERGVVLGEPSIQNDSETLFMVCFDLPDGQLHIWADVDGVSFERGDKDGVAYAALHMLLGLDVVAEVIFSAL